MNAKQSNKLASYAAVEAVLKAHPGIANVTGLPEKLALLGEKMGGIHDLAKTQVQPVRSSMAERDALLADMTDTTLRLAGWVRAVARRKEMPQLTETVRISRGSLRRVRRAHRAWFARRVHEAAVSVLSDLAEYGVTANTLADFESRINTASEGVSLPRNTTVAKKAATQQLAAFFRDVDALLEDEIDPFVLPLRKTDPEFHAAYVAARSVIDRPGARQRPASDPSPVEASPAQTLAA